MRSRKQFLRRVVGHNDGFCLAVPLLLVLLATQISMAQSPTGLERSRDFIESQRQRSDQMIRDAQARHEQFRRGIRTRPSPTYVQTSSESSTRSSGRSPRIRPRAIKGLIALVVLIIGGIWKLATGWNHSAPPPPMFPKQARPNASPTAPPAPMRFPTAPNTDRNAAQNGSFSPYAGLADKIRKR